MKLGMIASSVLAASIAAIPYSYAQRTLSHAHAYPSGTLPHEAAKQYAADVEAFSGGELAIKVYPLTLLSGSEMSDGIRDGLADSGQVLTVYFPSLYPHTNMVNESSMQLQLFDPDLVDNGRGALAFEGAMSEFIFEHCPECNQEYADQNQVYTGNSASARYSLLCTQEVTELAHMDGLRLRVAGAHWSRWIHELGGTSVSMTIGELTEALDQGVVDCTASALPELINLGMTDVVTDITTDIPGGVYAGASTASTNQDVWQSLTPDQRRALLKAGAYYAAALPYESVIRVGQTLDRAREAGIRIHQASPEVLQATREFVEKDLRRNIGYYATRHGITRGEEMLAQFRELLEKWVHLVQDIDSTEALGDLYWNEVYSKVNVLEHGV
ncbi:TRAP-type C4-dicarboxylate transport system, substrate-binding protein [Marinobacter daqiaonensis]|uniref:TRAP-type C4-dicarboxylate transport system, substrate-binding protein n=1 Tax=Marinobacter daqiaonensis TaxID=650891 RepID=A0A1I6I344_9GAMM|nr:C4-dicarboxylate TRAP transporter substrate-binding protein [Marinobacter daqiaonensis]SFR61074.1 TRAP-type C4-dicarboxylate transport system, substrate-binding protein [Marinobacter daqiaonensis]